MEELRIDHRTQCLARLLDLQIPVAELLERAPSHCCTPRLVALLRSHTQELRPGLAQACIRIGQRKAMLQQQQQRQRPLLEPEHAPPPLSQRELARVPRRLVLHIAVLPRIGHPSRSGLKALQQQLMAQRVEEQLAQAFSQEPHRLLLGVAIRRRCGRWQSCQWTHGVVAHATWGETEGPLMALVLVRPRPRCVAETDHTGVMARPAGASFGD